MSLKHIITISLALCLFGYINAAPFTIVIDAGHGGHDAGAIGSFSKEKNINLRHALLLGDMLKEKNPEIKVIYTRDNDVFVDLNERARIANRAKADLFVSIHTNAAKNRSANGVETFTLGVSRNKENMEVAMLENSVILLEDDYEKNYQGFDPNSTDSYIMFEFMKDQYMDRSITCADMVQTRLVNASQRLDRGVRQAGFLVLRATTMPSILVELGFISNREEEKSLNENKNQIALATALYKAIIAYKHDLEKKNGTGINTPAVPETPEPVIKDTIVVKQIEKEKTAETAPILKVDNNKYEDIVFMVQILSSKNKYKLNDAIFKGIKITEIKKEGNLYKYIVGKSTNLDTMFELRKNVSKEFPDAFIIAYKKGVKIPTKDAITEYQTQSK